MWGFLLTNLTSTLKITLGLGRSSESCDCPKSLCDNRLGKQYSFICTRPRGLNTPMVRKLLPTVYESERFVGTQMRIDLTVAVVKINEVAGCPRVTIGSFDMRKAFTEPSLRSEWRGTQSRCLRAPAFSEATVRFATFPRDGQRREWNGTGVINYAVVSYFCWWHCCSC